MGQGAGCSQEEARQTAAGLWRQWRGAAAADNFAAGIRWSSLSLVLLPRLALTTTTLNLCCPADQLPL